jgi:hypothetical protein
VGEQDEHQRKREGKAEEEIQGMRQNPADRKQRYGVIAQGKYWLMLQEVVFHPGSDDRGAEQRKKQEQAVKPPAWPGRSYHPNARLRLGL